ncbi:MAG: hypothetical protein PHD82_11910, partial [Candidatus Riflebacteria bacterium]|nr:hypothetical protein [Candidatus Riflebacteria bacterium]
MENRNKISSWSGMRLLGIIMGVLLVCCPGNVYALNQMQNSGFATDSAGWASSEYLTTFNTPAPSTAIDTHMTSWGWNATNGGCYYVVKQVGGNPNPDNQDANAILEQSFSTPADPINATVRFDHRDYYDACDRHWVYGTIRLDEPALVPNQTIVRTFFSDTTYAHTAAWNSINYDITADLSPSTNYLYRVYWYFRADRNDGGGAYVDNLRVDFSPSGLSASLSGGTNVLSWTPSVGGVALDGAAPYSIFRSTTSGVYGAALNTSLTNSYSDNSPPAGAIVYYTITDLGADGIVSPRSVELPVIRMTVNDGAAADVDTIIGDDVTMNWVNNVGAVSPTGYEVALGTSPGASDIVGWTAVGVGATNYTFSGQTLTNGTTYYCSIRVITATRTLNSSSSDGFVCVKTTVRDGSGPDLDLTSSFSDADMNWDALTIPVLRYEVALGTTPGATDLEGWIDVGAATSYSFTGLSLTNGSTYYCSVRAIDMSSSVIGVFSSDGFAPAVAYATTVRDGPAGDIDISMNATSIDLNWDDVVMTKVRYEAALGTTPGGTDVVGWTDMALANSGTLSGFTLSGGITYYCSVRIVLGAGPLPADSSDGFAYASIEVRDGPGADVDFTFSPDTVELNWDAPPFAVQKYEVAIGTTIGGTDLMNWTDAGTVTSTSFSGLSLVKNFYFCSVRVYDAGGTPLGYSTSNGFEALVPMNIVVRDGLGPDIAASYFDNRVELNWDYADANIIRYEVAVGTSKYNDNIHPWTVIGTVNSAVVNTAAELASGTTYYASVRGINNFKAIEAVGSSDGFVARRDPVLIDTASQSYFHNARVLNMIDTTSDPGSIRPKVFSGGGGAGYWRYSMPVTVTENNITDRVNAPCRVNFAIPGGQQPGAIGEFRVADSQGNEVPRYNMAGSTVANPNIVFLVNMAAGETKTYWIYWGNAGVTTTEADYHFTQNASLTSNIEWTPYYSRKNLPPGQEDVGAYDFDFGNRGDDKSINNFNLNWDFYFFGTLRRNGWDITTNGVLTTNSSWFGDYSNTWNEFIRTGADTLWTCVVTPIWIDLRTGPINPAPVDAGIYRDYLSDPDRVVFTWIANRYNSN